jgi:hypothetical protein
MVRKAGHMNQGDLSLVVRAAGVRASVVVVKPGNAGGAKGRRKVDLRRADGGKELGGIVREG